MGFFKDEKYDNITNELVEVRGEVTTIKDGSVKLKEENNILKSEIFNLKSSDNEKGLEIKNLKEEMSVTNQDLNGKIYSLEEQMEKILKVLSMERYEQEQNKIIQIEMDENSKEGWFSYNKICKASDTSVQQTELKYFLYDNGIFKKVINHSKNSFKLAHGNDISKYPDYIQQHCQIKKGQLLFDEWFIGYIKDNANDIKKSYDNALRKNKEYVETKEKLESINFVNYRDEIKRICNGDSKKYNGAYEVIREKYPTFWDDYNKSKEDQKDNPKYKKFGLSILEYICVFMKEGNYFLRIICELYA